MEHSWPRTGADIFKGMVSNMWQEIVHVNNENDCFRIDECFLLVRVYGILKCPQEYVCIHFKFKEIQITWEKSTRREWHSHEKYCSIESLGSCPRPGTEEDICFSRGPGKTRVQLYSSSKFKIVRSDAMGFFHYSTTQIYLSFFMYRLT